MRYGKAKNSVRQANTKRAFKAIVSGDTTTTSLDTTPSCGNAPTGNVMGCADFVKARFMFAGVGSDTQTVNYQVILWYPIDTNPGVQFVPVVVAHGAYTLGPMALPAGIVASALIADTVTDDTAWDGLVIENPTDDNVAMIEILLRGASHVSVETDLGTAATSAYVFVQFGE